MVALRRKPQLDAMTLPLPAVADTNWLEPDELYLATGDSVEVDRPIYQGDVFTDVPIPELPTEQPEVDRLDAAVRRVPVMLVPHPCQCYHGDKLRAYLTVAPIKEVPNYDNFRPDKSGAKDKFALPDLPMRTSNGTWSTVTCVADFGRLISLPRRGFAIENRIANLTPKGLGLLAKRVIGFQVRYSHPLAQAMSFTTAEWHESFLMQAWVRKHGSLSGYTNWAKTPISIPGLGTPGELTAPYEVRASANDALLELITNQPVIEPT
jgi:hypothetical protein